MNEQDLLERLVVNNPDLEKLEELLGDFNAFVVLAFITTRSGTQISWPGYSTPVEPMA